MKFYISYFYNIRFFNKNLIPLSTAVWDPKWYHQFKGHDHTYLDKNEVINGLRIELLNPSKVDAECCNCTNKGPTKCSFIKNYYEYLNTLDFSKVISELKVKVEHLAKEYQLDDPDVVLIVHEAPNNPCSERGPLIKWFSENGVELLEWNKSMQ